MCMPIRVVRVKKLGSSTPPSKNNLSCWGTRPKETTIRVMYAPPPPPVQHRPVLPVERRREPLG
ncbi:hypothetical protein HanIR_Chr12g0591001 [Helianthus annuus]|nr:hypothetical protein HanIR_Chr12g0591001 [Helianthus annuus]